MSVHDVRRIPIKAVADHYDLKKPVLLRWSYKDTRFGLMFRGRCFVCPDAPGVLTFNLTTNRFGCVGCPNALETPCGTAIDFVAHVEKISTGEAIRLLEQWFPCGWSDLYDSLYTA